ncbi:Predicted transporter component [Providencia rustigianii]|uniref:YeeE/YedE family protein n=2 Tax=Providencia rustigianii TaxID=158850 RepID=D1P467_9GAMM|nr:MULTISPECIES: YeeE/YedE family protein [Providencia]EFB71693.1 YeeE/YedE family protein [Providencia rustigianii DSM 4541]MTC55397.1 YeeE/YedE family protein [Providencia rustigianii]SPY78373.1 Predicted transporter component [Providencia rustigianii]SUC28012.1 Predicted transporter component [Providencia rustigianii]SUC36372.1 Predicted transporter component [Providencia rustigianii]
MTIDWANFTPWSAAIGGVLIGLAAAILLIFNGRIAGISGILAGILKPAKGDTAWKVAFILGIMVSPLLFTLFVYIPEVVITTGTPLLIVAGLLVGFGTRLGGGCTSGHGICGMARFSRRSIVAVVIFMLVAFATVAVINHFGLRG